MVRIVDTIAATVGAMWIWSALFIMLTKVFGREPWSVWRTLFHELKPFYLPACAVAYVCASIEQHKPLDPMQIVYFALSVASYWWWKDSDDDDDRWKRRRKKLVEKVTQRDGKLVVVAELSR